MKVWKNFHLGEERQRAKTKRKYYAPDYLTILKAKKLKYF